MLKFLCGINCILLHWPKKLTLEPVCLPLGMMQLNVYQKGNDRPGKVFENKLKLDSLYVWAGIIFGLKPWYLIKEFEFHATPSFKPDFHLDETNKIVNFDVFELQFG